MKERERERECGLKVTFRESDALQAAALTTFTRGNLASVPGEEEQRDKRAFFYFFFARKKKKKKRRVQLKRGKVRCGSLCLKMTKK